MNTQTNLNQGQVAQQAEERNTINIYITEPIPNNLITLLSSIQSNINIIYDPSLHQNIDKLTQNVSRCHVIVVRSNTKVDRLLIERAEDLEAIVRFGNGTNNIDKKVAQEKGIEVINSPMGNCNATAEYTIKMIFQSARDLLREQNGILAGDEINGKNLLIIGNGNIGKKVAQKAQTLGMRISIVSKSLSTQEANQLGYKLVTLEQGLPEADFITPHIPLTQDTHNLISDREFELMKDTARLINCARGGIVNEKALVRAIQSGKIVGATLDVRENELLPLTPEMQQLQSQGKLIVTDHLGGTTHDAFEQIAVEITQKLIGVLVRKKLLQFDKPPVIVV